MDNNGGVAAFAKLKGEAGGISFHIDGRLYVADLRLHKIIVIDEKGAAHDVVKDVNANFLTISDKGIYFTETIKDRIGLYSFSKKEVRYISVPFHPTDLAISAEQTFLNVGVSNQVFGYSYKVMEDGSLDFGQAYIHYHVPYGETTPGTAGMAVDAGNLLYSATTMGIQVVDQLGRVNFIFSKPAEGAVDVKLGGMDFNILYVSCNGRLFSRKINARGVLSWISPAKPPKPGL